MEEDSQARGKLIEAAQSAAKAASLKDIGHSFTNGFGATEHSTPGVGSPTSTTPAPVLPPNTEASYISHHAASTPSASRRKSSLVLHNSSLSNLLNNPPPSNPQFPSTGHSHADAHADRFTDNHQTVSTAAASKSGPSSGTLPPPPATTGHHSVPVASTHVSASAPTLSTTKAPLRTPLMAPPPATAQGAPASPLSPMPKKKSSSDTPSSSQPKLTKRCKVRIQLPDFAGGAIETVVREGEDLMEAAKVIAKEHNLSLGYQQKVYDQLRAAFKK